MSFDQILGNDNVKQALLGMVECGRVPHAIMFHEDDGGGGVPFCLAFLESLMSSPKVGKMIHPDVHFVYPVSGAPALSFVAQWRELVLSNPYFTENELSQALGLEMKSSLIAVADARDILGKLSFNSLEGGWRAVVVYLPEKMNADAANRLLKSIEEPPAKTLFLMVTHAPEKVLKTISSRCQNIRLCPTDASKSRENEYIASSREIFAELMETLLARDLSGALEVGEKLVELKSRERQKAFCRAASDVLRQVFLRQQGLPGGDDVLVGRMASSLKKTFPRNALAVMDRAMLLIERNVNQKIVFCDMVDRLYLYI